ncbi:unnamed protein product [Onchocerca ochengi]|uniref:Ovule protein n=1 Tax=Onchocerca ochengi TaxID=42157 RepID=A0A182E3B2_ONCOC|nr:unnamed protein product [Onchocerca ochengi]
MGSCTCTFMRHEHTNQTKVLFCRLTFFPIPIQLQNSFGSYRIWIRVTSNVNLLCNGSCYLFTAKGFQPKRRMKLNYSESFTVSAGAITKQLDYCKELFPTTIFFIYCSKVHLLVVYFFNNYVATKISLKGKEQRFCV